jgi:predicted HTH domain antitoxin
MLWLLGKKSVQFIQATRRTEAEIRLHLAIIFYTDFKMSAGKCGAFVGMSRVEFFEELGNRQIPRNYDVEDFENDLKTLYNQ